MTAGPRLLSVPGITGAGEQHWQTLWERELGDRAIRFAPASWDFPDLQDWLDAVRRGVADAGDGCVVVAHSLGCLAVAHLAAGDLPCRGVVLVAPPDVHDAAFPADASAFAALVAQPLRVPGLVIASSDDPFATPAASRALGQAWKVPVVDVGEHGHLNTASGLGHWPAGRRLVTAFAAGAGAGPWSL